MCSIAAKKCPVCVYEFKPQEVDPNHDEEASSLSPTVKTNIETMKLVVDKVIYKKHEEGELTKNVESLTYTIQETGFPKIVRRKFKSIKNV